jgi:hypothetical protein
MDNLFEETVRLSHKQKAKEGRSDPSLDEQAGAEP